MNASLDAAQAMQSFPSTSSATTTTPHHHHHHHAQHRQTMSAPSLPSSKTTSANSAMKYISRSTSSILRPSSNEHDHSTQHSILHPSSPALPEQISESHGDDLPHSHHCQTADDFNYALNLHMGVVGDIFGRSLHETSPNGHAVPDIVLDCLLYLLHNSLKVEGIFRISGDEDTVADLRRSYDEGKSHPSYRTIRDDSPTTSHDLASLIKYYLRLLPEPLFPKKFYRSLTETLQLPDAEYVTRMRNMFLSPRRASSEEQAVQDQDQEGKIPVVNLKILSYLSSLLYEITRHTEVNKMTGDNLAIIFAPSILCPEGSHELGLYELQNGIAIMKRMLLHSVEIFEPLWRTYPLESAATAADFES
jgi:hypothetical protein